MPLQLQAITLGCMLVVAVGTLIYSYVTTRQQPQQHGYGRSSSSHSRPDSDFIDTVSIPPPVSKDNGRPRKRKNGDDCSICLATINLPLLITLPCKHVFHSHCITTWLNSNKTCPNCRKEVEY